MRTYRSPARQSVVSTLVSQLLAAGSSTEVKPEMTAVNAVHAEAFIAKLNCLRF